MSLLNTLLKPVRATAGAILGKGERVSPQLEKRRLEICGNCKYLFLPTFSCKKCMCFTQEKIKYSLEKCPIGKW